MSLTCNGVADFFSVAQRRGWGRVGGGGGEWVACMVAFARCWM